MHSPNGEPANVVPGYIRSKVEGISSELWTFPHPMGKLTHTHAQETLSVYEYSTDLCGMFLAQFSMRRGGNYYGIR